MRFRMKKAAAVLAAILMLMTVVPSALSAPDARKLDAYYSLGVQYISRENYEKALEYLQAALECCDEETSAELLTDIHLKIAYLYTLGQQYEYALQELEILFGIAPDLAEGYLIRVQVYSETGEYAAAAQDLEKYIELTGLTENYETVSRLYSMAGDQEKALKSWQAYLDAAQVTGSQKTFETASWKVQSGQYREAIADFEALLEDEEYGKTAAYYIGVCYLELGEYEQALSSFDQCAAFASEIDGIQYNIGTCYMQLGKYSEAIEAFSASYATETCQTDALYHRALCHFSRTGEDLKEEERTSEIRSAVEDFTAYLSLMTEKAKVAAGEGAEVPETVDAANYYRAVCYFSLEEYEKAIADYTACIEQGVYAEESRYSRSLIYLQIGMLEEAKAELTTCIENGIHEDECLYYRSMIHDQQGDTQAAIDDLTLCIEHGYNLGEMYYQRAQLYLKLNDMDHYIEDLEASVQY